MATYEAVELHYHADTDGKPTGDLACSPACVENGLATDLDADTLAYVEAMPVNFDDESDYSTRYAHLEAEFSESPTIERIRTRRALTEESLPHAPGVRFDQTSCLCTCHYVARVTCDERECAKGGEARRRFFERKNARRQARVGGAA